jgi:hypothetical protein
VLFSTLLRPLLLLNNSSLQVALFFFSLAALLCMSKKPWRQKSVSGMQFFYHNSVKENFVKKPEKNANRSMIVVRRMFLAKDLTTTTRSVEERIFYAKPQVVVATRTICTVAAASSVSSSLQNIALRSAKSRAAARLAKHASMTIPVAASTSAKVTTHAHSVPALASHVAPMTTAARAWSVMMKSTFVSVVLAKVYPAPPMKTVVAQLASNA